MRTIDLTEFHQAAPPSESNSDGAFHSKFLFDIREESFNRTSIKRKLNTARKVTNEIFLHDICRSKNADLQQAFAKTDFKIHPFLAVKFSIDFDAEKADAWIQGKSIIFDAVYTFDHLDELKKFMDSTTQPYFVWSYPVLEMLKNCAEWDLWHKYLNFNIKQATATDQNGYVFYNNGIVSCLKDYKPSVVQPQQHNSTSLPFTIHRRTAYKLHEAVKASTPQGEPS